MSRTVVWTPEVPGIGPAVAAIGVFDGVHVGHQTLVADAVRIARMQGAAAAVVTFDRDPDQVVSPAGAAPQLLDLEDKLSLLEDQGPDVVLVVPFDPEKFKDSYRETLRAMIDAKIGGQEIVQAPAAQELAPVVDIMDALKSSLSALRKPPIQEAEVTPINAAKPKRRKAAGGTA